MKWKCIFDCVRADGSTFDCFEAQPDLNKPFALRCRVCADALHAGVGKSSRWSAYGFRGATCRGEAKINVEDLKRHCNISKGQRDGKIPLDKAHAKALAFAKVQHAAAERGGGRSLEALTPNKGSDPSCAPSEEQIRLAVEICWGWGGTSLSDYEKRCASERDKGADLPYARSSRHAGRKIIIAAAEVEFQEDRTHYVPRALEISWAQDKANNMLLMKYRAVSKDFQVVDRMLDLMEPTGDRALQCSRDMELALDRLCSEPRRVCLSTAPSATAGVVSGILGASAAAGPAGAASGSSSSSACASAVPCVADHAPARKSFEMEWVLQPAVKRHFQKVCRNATADGAADEQLALRLSKACSALPELDFIVRAEEHSCVVVMRNASEKCEWLQPLLLALVSRLSSGKRQPGGFARYVHNSPRFKRKVAFVGGPLTTCHSP